MYKKSTPSGVPFALLFCFGIIVLIIFQRMKDSSICKTRQGFLGDFCFLNLDKILSPLYNDRIMGQIPQPETKRDEALIRDYLLKEDEVWAYSLTQLGVRYAREVDGVTIPLTSSRISQILERHKVPRKRVSR